MLQVKLRKIRKKSQSKFAEIVTAMSALKMIYFIKYSCSGRQSHDTVKNRGKSTNPNVKYKYIAV